MFGWDEAQDAHQQVYYQQDDQGNQGYDNQAKFSHELIAGAASFEGMKLFEDHQRNEGKPVSHKFAKELLAGFVGGEVDKLAETKGMNEYDTIEARRHAKQASENMYDQHYIQQQGADQYDPNQYERHERLNYRDQNREGYRDEYRDQNRDQYRDQNY